MPFSYLLIKGTYFMHTYRSHTCGQLRAADAGKQARLSGWIHRKRDHGNLVFIDLRDHYGITQCVVDPDSAAFKLANEVRSEWVVRVDGKELGHWRIDEAELRAALDAR